MKTSCGGGGENNRIVVGEGQNFRIVAVVKTIKIEAMVSLYKC